MSAFDDVAADIPPISREPSLTSTLNGDTLSEDHARWRDEILLASQLGAKPQDALEAFNLRFTSIMRECAENRAVAHALLSFTGEDARLVLNAMQLWLDCDTPSSSHGIDLYRRGLAYLIKLAALSGELPPSLFLYGVDINNARDPTSLGGFADIFRGTYLGRPVAVKRLRLFTIDAKQMHRVFCKEALVWRQLKHPHVLPFLGLDAQTFKGSGHVCMVSPWLSRGTVMQLIQSGEISKIDRLKLLREVASGLLYLHRLKVIHGDIHSGNIFIDDTGGACVADFGISVVGDETMGRLTTTVTAAGAIRWMAPERLDPESANGRLAAPGDVWAFACLCLMLHTLQQPFHTISSAFAVQLHVVMGKIPARPTEEECQGHALSDELWLLMTECWKRDPVMRPSMETITERINDLPSVNVARPSILSSHQVEEMEVEESKQGVDEGYDERITDSPSVSSTDTLSTSRSSRFPPRKRPRTTSLIDSSTTISEIRSQPQSIGESVPQSQDDYEPSEPDTEPKSIDSLSDETLIEIFSYISFQGNHTLALIRAVCRRWFYLVGKTPYLWRFLKLVGHGSELAYLIKAAKHVHLLPVDVKIEGHAGSMLHWVSMSKLLKSLFSGVRSLSVSLPEDELRAFITEWDVAHPGMQFLTLTQIARNGGPIRDENCTVVASSMITSLRDLQMLSLNHVAIPWKQLQCQNLRILEIVGEHQGVAPTMTGFLATLRELPALEVLTLIGLVPSYTNINPADGLTLAQVPVKLPRLHSLKMDNQWIHKTALMLMFLSLPVLKKLEVACKIDIHTEGFMSFFRPGVKIGLLQTLTSVHYTCEGSEMASLTNISTTREYDISLDLWFTGPQVEHTTPSFFSKLPKGLEVCPNVTVLSISDTGHGRGTTDEWLSVLESAPHLRELIINRVSCERGEFGLFRALEWSVCPNLRTITIYGMDAAELDIDEIVSNLEARKRVEFPLGALHLEWTTGITDRILYKLRRVIPEVIWTKATR